MIGERYGYASNYRNHKNLESSSDKKNVMIKGEGKEQNHGLNEEIGVKLAKCMIRITREFEPFRTGHFAPLFVRVLKKVFFAFESIHRCGNTSICKMGTTIRW